VISYNIDGSSQNQLLDFLSVIANPDVYATKLKELQAATEENKKYVEAVAPVSDIVALRESLYRQNADAADALEAAKTQAEQIVGNAQISAAVIVSDAQAQAQTIVAQATATKEGADALSTQVTAALSDAKKAEKEAKAATAEAKAQSDSAAAAQAATEALQAEVADIKAVLLAKTKAFIEGL
jgi:cell division septum initiation protein DivIVA